MSRLPKSNLSAMFWCGLPQLLALPPAGYTDSEPDLAELVATLREAVKRCAPDASLADLLGGIDRLEKVAKDGRAGMAIAVAWNLAQKLGFAYGQAERASGGGEVREKERANRAKGGGRKVGAGRKVGISDAEIRAAYEKTNTKFDRRARARDAIKAGALRKADGSPLSIETVLKRLGKRRIR